MNKISVKYGCDNLGMLKTVLVHTPGKELELVNKTNFKNWLFDDVPNIKQFIDEHLKYQELLKSYDVKVLELSDYVHKNKHLIQTMPNVTYVHDIAVISDKGYILSQMKPKAREKEQIVIKEALNNLGIPKYFEFSNKNDVFEGCLVLSPDTILVAHTERHSYVSIKKFIKFILKANDFKEVIYIDVPKERRYMHSDTVFNRISDILALAYLPAIKETYVFTKQKTIKVDFKEYMKSKGIDIVNISDSEQRRLGCTFVPLKPNVLFHYDTALDKDTIKILSNKGVEFIFFHPKALLCGGGSLRCHTLRIHRQLLQ